MKPAIRTAILAVLLLPALIAPVSPVRADPVDTAVYLGKGLQKRKSRNWIGLRCISDKPVIGLLSDCSAFQHVVYDEVSGKTSDIGPRIANDDYLVPRMRSLGISFREYLNTTTRRQTIRTVAIMLTGAVALFVPMILASGEAPIMAAGTAAAIQKLVGLPILFALTPLIGNNPDKANFNAGSLNHAMQDQNGWNWEDHPKHLRAKIFDKYIQFLSGCEKYSTCYSERTVRYHGEKIRVKN
jgi:hypothetical protein